MSTSSFLCFVYPSFPCVRCRRGERAFLHRVRRRRREQKGKRKKKWWREKTEQRKKEKERFVMFRDFYRAWTPQAVFRRLSFNFFFKIPGDGVCAAQKQWTSESSTRSQWSTDPSAALEGPPSSALWKPPEEEGGGEADEAWMRARNQSRPITFVRVYL